MNSQNHLIIIAAVLITLATSCNQAKDTRKKYIPSKEQDSLDAIIDARSAAINDHFGEDKLDDTTKLYLSPVLVTKAEVIESAGGSYRNVRIYFRNKTNKKIDAVRFTWKGVTAFDEPAEMGDSDNIGYGFGFYDHSISPKAAKSTDFNILSENAKKVTLAFPTEVKYSDGTVWKLGMY